MPKRSKIPDPYREEKRDAILSLGALLSALLVIVGNIVAWYSNNYSFSGLANLSIGREIIAVSLCAGVPFALILSARILYRHRIHLGAWMLMFAINAIGMLLATQLFKWLHPSVNAALDKMPPDRVTASALNALLLAIALASALLVRGASLLKNAHRMPEWMAKRDEKNNLATPRMWLFALFWITPIAWWALILCTLYFVKFKSDSTLLKLTTAILLIIVTTRIAVRMVLFEKNKHTSWRRRATGWPLLLQWTISAGMVCAGALTFYAYFFMTTRVQEDAFIAQIQVEQDMILSELQAFKTEPVPASENAETIYKLARTSLVPINWEWAKDNLESAETGQEIAKNITALSYFRQGGAKKEIDFGFDWSRPQDSKLAWKRISKQFSELESLGCLEMRVAAGKGDWRTALDDLKAGLAYARIHSRVPSFTSFQALAIESSYALTFFSAISEFERQPNDMQLSEARTILLQHVNSREEFVKRAAYHLALSHCMEWNWSRENVSGGFIAQVDFQSMLENHALIEWGKHQAKVSALPIIKLASLQRLDRRGLSELRNTLEELHIQGDMRQVLYILRVSEDNLYSLASLRMLEAAISIERYRRFYGRWPGKVEDCIPQFMSKIPSDPYIDGELVHYEASPPRIFCAGIKGSYKPETHGYPNENRFKYLTMSPSQKENGDLVLFLGNEL